jgi:antitoxin component YwqK of YwqJK toxin-antitoxin module
MTQLKKIIVPILVLGLMSFNQYPDNLTSLRPKHSPDSVTHRNKYDDKGKKWGNWQYYSRNGVLIFETSYKDNKLNGEFVRYNGITGNMLEKGAYLNDLKNGSFTKWYNNGVKRVEGSYRKGMKNGIWSYYFKNSPGVVRLTGNFKAGKKSGKWVFYDKNETIRSVVKYNNGIITDSKEIK